MNVFMDSTLNFKCQILNIFHFTPNPNHELKKFQIQILDTCFDETIYKQYFEEIKKHISELQKFPLYSTVFSS